MRVGIVAVGRLKAGAEQDLYARYLDRARKAGRQLGLTGFDTVEIAESREAQAARRRAAEADAVMARVPGGALRVVLDEGGAMLGSGAFAERIAGWRDSGAADLVFLVGGPDGHGEAARRDAAALVGFGAMTWPHQLVRVMLAEQLYRTTTILSGHPYHRT